MRTLKNINDKPSKQEYGGLLPNKYKSFCASNYTAKFQVDSHVLHIY